MKGVYRILLDTHNEALCKGMDPAKVANRLVKSGVFRLFDLEHVNSKIATQEKNEEIISRLQNRSFKDLSVFLCVLTSIDYAHYELALQLQPVTRHILVFSPSSSHAAAMVYVMEKYAGAKFSKMERVGTEKALVLRRARVFPRELNTEDIPLAQRLRDKERALSSHRTELSLVFPAYHAPGDATSALESLFSEGLVSSADVVLMSVVCGRRERGGAVIATQVCCTETAEAKPRSLETHLSHALSEQSSERTWRDEVAVDLEFGVSWQPLIRDSNEPPNLDSAGDTSNSAAFTLEDPLSLGFSALCRDQCPGKCSTLLCCGLLPHEAEPTATAEVSLASGGAELDRLGSESIAALTSSGVLKETCEYFDKQLDQE